MMRFLPPAGVPLKVTDILGSMSTAISPNGRTRTCLASIAERLQVKHVLGASSGRAALWLILKALHELHPDRDVVALPAYTCFSVPAAVVRAGLKLHPVEVNTDTLDFDRSQLGKLPSNRLLCIVACNLFGIPNDFSVIREAARASGAYVVDDAAQALGATRRGQHSGTFGDVGLYSLGRGKAIGSIEGGLIVTDSDDLARRLQTEAESLGAPDVAHGARLLFEMFSYSILLQPHLFWIPNSLPFLKLGTTEFQPSFPTDKLHPLSLGLLTRALAGLNQVNESRRANAKAIARALRFNSDFVLPGSDGNSEPTFVRLPVVARDHATRDRAVARLRDAGIGATAFYPTAICDIPGIERYMSNCSFHCTRAEEVSQRLLTLPVHRFVQPQDIERMVEILTTL